MDVPIEAVIQLFRNKKLVIDVDDFYEKMILLNEEPDYYTEYPR